jgi:hypothetical protein
MSNNIILLENRDDALSITVPPTTFAELGVLERKHLEEWIKNNPDILGTKLLLIDSEYDGFDKSDKRLDLLALDYNGKLVIIELKRDASASHADLQAIRYAAFCSSMTFDTLVSLYAAFAKNGDNEEAKRSIQQFVGDVDFSTLDDKPRIILAAATFDTEITSCVLWLRSFGVDISCVEIAPYRMPDNRIVLAPRVIIPLPEAADYIVKAEKKQAEQGQQKKFSLEEILNLAERRMIRPLVDLCREVGRNWDENAASVYGGSFVYSLTTSNGWRSLFGINVSGQRKNTPLGSLDVWIPMKNLAEQTKRDQSEIRAVLNQANLQVVAEEKIDLVIRLNNVDEAQAVVAALKTLAADRIPDPVELGSR